MNLVLEAATGLFGKTAEEAEDGFLAFIVTGQDVVPAVMPNNVVGYHIVQRRHVSTGERFIPGTGSLDSRGCFTA